MKKPPKILHISDLHFRHNGRLYYSTTKKINNGFILNNYSVLHISDRDITRYNKTVNDYKGTKYFDTNDNPVSTASEDQCGHKYSSCIKRFTGKKTKVPFGGFLNARLQM